MARETKGFVRRTCPRERESGERYDERQRKKASIRAEEIQQVNGIERLSLQVVPDVKRCRGDPRRDRGQGVFGRQREEWHLGGPFSLPQTNKGGYKEGEAESTARSEQGDAM
jgi:hypothetical protein